MISERSTSMIFLNETTPYLYMSAGYPLWDSLLMFVILFNISIFLVSLES